MKAVAIFVFCLLAVVSADLDVAFEKGVSFAEIAAKGNCFPDCTWNCDQPSCPAVCEPQCEKPQCELRCEKLPDTSCDIRCEKPKCEVRCSRTNCQSGGCPVCENVCLPARCQTVCTPATPNCKPTCSAPKCTWLCHKPTKCPKPKCSLGCSNKASPIAAPGCTGTSGPAGSGSGKCCPCNGNNVKGLSSAMEIASAVHVHVHGQEIDSESVPSMMEVAHEVRMQENLGQEAQCCPCTEEY